LISAAVEPLLPALTLHRHHPAAVRKKSLIWRRDMNIRLLLKEH
jgi:hypothetical protein